MRNLSLFFLLILCSLVTYGQVPSVKFIDNPMGNNEETPALTPAADGGFFITHTATKSSPDSIFGILTRLNASQDVLWSKVFKMRLGTNITNVEEATDGSLTALINSYQTAVRYHPVLTKLSSTGNILSTTELLDSANANEMYSFFRFVSLQNGSRFLLGSSSGVMVRVNGQGQVDYSRQYYMGAGTGKPLYFSGGKAIPGTNQWYAHGHVKNTNLSFLLKMQDTTVLKMHVYDFNTTGTTNYGIGNLHIFPNGELLGSHNYNSTMLNLYRLTADGAIIWRKNYKLPTISPQTMTVDSQNDIWMHGSITPGQAGGILFRFSPTGNLLAQRTQNKQGVSLGNLRGFAELPNNEYLTMQRGYYNNSPTLIMNRIHNNLDFLCFNSNLYNIIDTSYAIVDSAVTKINRVKLRIGPAPALSYPIQTFSPTVSTGNVVCTPNATAEPLSAETYLLVPNPAGASIQIQGLERQPLVRIFNAEGRLMREEMYSGSISIQKLPSGLYWLDVPDLKWKKRFVKE